MDFGEFIRGGTAPTGKSKVSSNLQSTGVNNRPKTRAVDSDIQDTNIDLKNNRLKSGSNSRSPDQEFIDDNEKEFARIGLNDWSDRYDSTGGIYNNNASKPRATSRGKKSKDPLRQNTQNGLMSGLSAYTQNMPNIVLNTQNRSKSHKVSSSSPRTTSGKEFRNSSQIQDLRAAYGADIPIGKQPSSPGSKNRPGTSSRSSQQDGTRPQSGIPSGYRNERTSDVSLPSNNDFRLNGPALTLKKPVEANSTSSIGSSNIDTIDNGRGLASNRSTFSSTSDMSCQGSPSKRKPSRSSLLKVSFSSKQSDDSNLDPANMVAGDHSPAHSISPSEDMEREHRDGEKKRSSPDNHILIPVETFFEEMMKKPAKGKSSSPKASPKGSPKIVASRKKESNDKRISEKEKDSAKNPSFSNNSNSRLDQQPSSSDVTDKSNLISYSTSDYTLNVPDDVFLNLKGDSEVFRDEKERRDRALSDDNDWYEDQLRKQQQEQSRLASGKADLTLTLNDWNNDSNHGQSSGKYYPQHSDLYDNTRSGDDDDSDREYNPETTPRPQSRKLYLGSEKSSSREPTSSGKTPKSAGPRYGSYSPIKGGIEIPPTYDPSSKDSKSPANKKGSLKKLSSHGDLTEWIDCDPSSLKNRPPSRQSTAFPVHLSSEPSTAQSSALNTDAIPSSSIGKKGGETVMKRSLEEDDDYSRNRHGIPLVNTEPRTVGGKKSSKNDMKDEVNNGSEPVVVYNVRPPSRQKVAAQHLFDENGVDRGSTTSGLPLDGGLPSSRRSSRKEINSNSRDMINIPYETSVSKGSLKTAAGGVRPSTTRGGMMTQSSSHHHNSDGFADLDPDDSLSPFPITINFGNTDGNLKGPAIPANNRSRTSSHDKGYLDSNDFPSAGVDYSPYPSVGSVSGRRSNHHLSPRNAVKRGGGYVDESTGSQYDSYHPAPNSSSHRPKSVTAIPHETKDSHCGKQKHNKTSLLNYDPKQEENTLRSKSANHYSQHHRLYNPVHSEQPSLLSHNNSVPTTPLLPSKPQKQNIQPVPPNRTKAWDHQPDPRHLPRAQVSFFL
jgi:hypothetical protein